MRSSARLSAVTNSMVGGSCGRRALMAPTGLGNSNSGTFNPPRKVSGSLASMVPVYPSGGDLLKPGAAVPEAVARLGQPQPGHALGCPGAVKFPADAGAENLKQLRRVRRLRRHAQHIDARGAQFVDLVDEVVHLRRLRLDAVQRQERLAFARLDRQAVGEIHALELAVVLLQVEVARREAARGERQRQAPVGEDFGFHAFGAT